MNAEMHGRAQQRLIIIVSIAIIIVIGATIVFDDCNIAWKHNPFLFRSVAAFTLTQGDAHIRCTHYTSDISSDGLESHCHASSSGTFDVRSVNFFFSLFPERIAAAGASSILMTELASSG